MPTGARVWATALLRRRGQPAAEPPSGFVERLTERSRAERRLLRRKVLIAVAVLAVLAAAGWVVLVSPLLALDPDEVSITGTGEGTTVATEDVRDIVTQWSGTPLARLDAPALRAEIEHGTTVLTAEVHRAWPTGLTIDVVPRVSVAALETGDGVALLDAEGVTVAEVPDVPESMPQVDVPRSGERAQETLQAVLGVLAELPEELRADVAVAGATSPTAITLELDDGAEVRWGGTAESELKAAVLEVLRAEPAKVYDLTVPRSPTTSG